jgi:rhamnogalacturonan endolyase
MKRLNRPPLPRVARRSTVLLCVTALVWGLGVTAVSLAEPSSAASTAVNDPTSTTEHLDRGLISMRSGNSNFLSWRLLKTDPADAAFDVYRGSTRVNTAPITRGTDFTDAGAPAGAGYSVVPAGTTTLAASAPTATLASTYMDVPIQIPAGGTTPDGVAYTYSANDASVGDLDGDGQYEIVLKWDPSNSKDNSQSGYTGDVYVDAYKLNGTRLWRIDLGKNIRAGRTTPSSRSTTTTATARPKW